MGFESSKHGGSRKRGHWRIRRRVPVRLVDPPAEGIEPLLGEATYAYAQDDEPLSQPLAPEMVGRLKTMARLLWEGDYKPLLELERQQLEAMSGVMTAARILKEAAPPSTYVTQGKGRNKQRREQKEEAQAGDMASLAIRQANQWTFTFSCSAQSVRALTRRLPFREWRKQVKARALADRKTSLKLTKLMTAVRPAPDWVETSAIQHFVYDQLYAKKVHSSV